MDGTITPKNPDSAWLKSYLTPSLVAAKAYQIDTIQVPVKLDQNESPWDWPDHLKKRILDQVKAKSWNRYPSPMADELTAELARYVGVPTKCVLTGPGSNFLITLLFDGLARRAPGKVVVARPSFALFESHLAYSGIAYEPWTLTEDLEYDVARLPELPRGSLVIFASPNNPTGNSLPYDVFKRLLAAHPETMFVADEAYYEFADEPYTDLLAEFSNLIILRTLSKTMGAAGVRLGYLLGAEATITELGKLRLPYLLNHFAIEATLVILRDPEMQEFIALNIANARGERDRLHRELSAIGKKAGFTVKNSNANFLLMKWPSTPEAHEAYHKLIEGGVLVRDVSRGPGLAGCLRVSIGTREENDQFLAALAQKSSR